MKKFLLKIIFFPVPVLLLYSFPLLVFVLNREFTPLNEVLAVQSADRNVLFNTAYNNTEKVYKKLLLETRNPELIILGTSRVMEIRSEFFKEPEGAVNLGGIMYSSPDDLPAVIRDLPKTSKVRLIIVGIDQWFLNSARGAWNGDRSSASLAERFRNFLGNGWRDVYRDYFAKVFTLGQLIGRNRQTKDIGMFALVSRLGFRGDGSVYYGKQIGDPNRLEALKQEVGKTVSFTEKAIGLLDWTNLEYGGDVGGEHLKNIQDFLGLAKERQIYVIGFLPPYHSDFLAEMRRAEVEGKNPMMAIYPEIYQKQFSDFGFPLFDFTDVKSFGGNDREFIDPVHSNDKALLRIIINMAKRDRILGRYVDLPALKSLLKSATDDFVLVRDEDKPVVEI
jgi:hypothetical protein